MKLRKYLGTPALALLVATGACDEGLTGINRNPNSPEVVPAENLLVNAITDAIGADYGTHGVWAGLYLTNIWSQQLAEVKYNQEDLYEPRPDQIDGIWERMYTDPLADLKLVKQIAEEEGDDNLFAVAEIMSQYVFHYLTDVYGAIPYSEALAGAENTHPKYDSQQEVYNSMLANLTAAVERIDASEPGSFKIGDVLYKGDMEAWRKFANSLRMRVAMRLADVDPDKARTEFVAAYNAGGFTSNDDNASLVWGTELPSQNPRYDYWYNQDRYDFVISDAMVSRLQAYKDPRLPIYADTAKGAVYRGLPNGKLPGDFGLNVPDYSPVGARFLEPDAPSDVMTYAEVLFLEAEAAARGWISDATAADLYEQAITASMKQYGISDADIADYLAQSAVAYAGLNSIWEQKWIALYMNGPEAWAEVRRTGVPNLTPATGTQIPARLQYPTGEQLYNADNWKEAGGESATLWTKMWWMGN